MKPKLTYSRRAALLLAAAAILVAGAAAALFFSGGRAPTPPVLAAQAYILVDLADGAVLHSRNAELQMELGSLTKLAAVYVCLQAVEDGTAGLEDQITVSAEAAGAKGSVAGLPQGARLALDDLLRCVLLPSGNDAVLALSQHICGTETQMVQRMNDLAGDLGLTHTAYTDCSGLDSFNNRSTAGELALLISSLLERYPHITGYTATQLHTATYWLDNREHSLALRNSNKLLGVMTGVTGLKTGTLRSDHHTAVVLERDGKRLLAIVLGAPSDQARWDSAKALLEYGLSL